jgi:hypothetical protein
MVIYCFFEVVMKAVIVFLGIAAGVDFVLAMEPNMALVGEVHPEIIVLAPQNEADMLVARQAADSVWAKYNREDLLHDNCSFDGFFKLVFQSGYGKSPCFNAPLLEYRMMLATSFIEFAARVFGTRSGDKQAQTEIAQKAFLIYFAARFILPCQFDASGTGIALKAKVYKMLLYGYDYDLDKTPKVIAFRDRLSRRRSDVDYKIAIQMNGAYLYAKEHFPQMVDYLWHFFYERKLVRCYCPLK